MTHHDYKQTAYYLIYLTKCVLNDKIPAKEKLDKMDLPQLFEVAENHSLTAAAAYALESAGIYDESFTQCARTPCLILSASAYLRSLKKQGYGICL